MDNSMNNTAISLSSTPHRISQSSSSPDHHQFWHLITNPTATTTTDDFNLNDEKDNTDSQNDKEVMFEKPLTPSDVGKLNRLVIPKQHAERYFPLAADAAAEKGLLLSFEDDAGKPWRFRYSYWNSSQSYVLTKGWSRFVKENHLDAGDVVLFLRHRSRSDRLFIGSRRRDATVAGNNNNSRYPTHPHQHNHSHAGHYLSLHQNQNNRPVVPYQPDSSSSIHSGIQSPAHHQNQTTTVGNNNNNNNSSSSKILRLFGVNLECHDNQEEQCSEPLTPDGSSFSSQDLHQHQFYPQPYYPNLLHNHMDFTFSRDVKPMRDRRR